jgi:hypothetical protein
MTEAIFRNAKLESGRLIIDLPPEQRGPVMGFLRTKKDKDYSLTIKEHKVKRSNPANAYAWKVIGIIADFLRVPPTVVYKQAILNVPDNYDILQIQESAYPKFKQAWESQGIAWPCVLIDQADKPGFVEIQAYYGSSTYDTKQFSILIDSLLQDCRALGLEVRPDEEIQSLLESVR